MKVNTFLFNNKPTLTIISVASLRKRVTDINIQSDDSSTEMGQEALEFYNLATGRLLSALEVNIHDYFRKNMSNNIIFPKILTLD